MFDGKSAQMCSAGANGRCGDVILSCWCLFQRQTSFKTVMNSQRTVHKLCKHTIYTYRSIPYLHPQVQGKPVLFHWANLIASQTSHSFNRGFLGEAPKIIPKKIWSSIRRWWIDRTEAKTARWGSSRTASHLSTWQLLGDQMNPNDLHATGILWSWSCLMFDITCFFFSGRVDV